MLTFKSLSWGFWFSYGDNNTIQLDANPLTQIVGPNGFGKSSVALILEETCFNKNSKGIKKADIINRNTKAKKYWSTLTFSRDSDEYEIAVVRGATASVTLRKNNQDISGHTPTQTYALIQEVLGFDHKEFSQVIYLSSANSLEFLTATDTNRKKFLIELLELSYYTQYQDTFKSELASVQSSLDKITGKISAYTTWLEEHKATDLVLQDVLPVPILPKELVEELSTLKTSTSQLDTRNKIIVKNNKYKELLDQIDLKPQVSKPIFQLEAAQAELAKQKQIALSAKTLVDKVKNLGSKCPTCLQSIDLTAIRSITEENLKVRQQAEAMQVNLTSEITEGKAALLEWQTNVQAYKDFEEYSSLYDPTEPKELLDAKQLTKSIHSIESIISNTEKEIALLVKKNKEIETRNTRVKLVLEQLEEKVTQVDILKQEAALIAKQASNLEILVKTFSPSGLVAYKIESLIKDLENAANEYLIELSLGRFQLSFKIEKNDKLNVVISDSGLDIEILALSSGERARVNTAALLGIRKLMQGISKNRCNLLILDETIENLDVEGKEKLVEVLLKEPYLNTFIVSHGFQHPLLEKLYVSKVNNMSRIE